MQCYHATQGAGQANELLQLISKQNNKLPAAEDILAVAELSLDATKTSSGSI